MHKKQFCSAPMPFYQKKDKNPSLGKNKAGFATEGREHAGLFLGRLGGINKLVLAQISNIASTFDK